MLDATLADEAEHEGFGFEYVRRALESASAGERAAWRKVAAEALRPQRERALAVLREVPPAQQTLDAFPDEAEVALGLFSNQRQALVLQQTYEAS